MNEIIKINNHDVAVKEYKGQRVVTFKDIDTVHERPDGTAKRQLTALLWMNFSKWDFPTTA